LGAGHSKRFRSSAAVHRQDRDESRLMTYTACGTLASVSGGSGNLTYGSD
jgi:hypothetical protein